MTHLFAGMTDRFHRVETSIAFAPAPQVTVGLNPAGAFFRGDKVHHMDFGVDKEHVNYSVPDFEAHDRAVRAALEAAAQQKMAVEAAREVVGEGDANAEASSEEEEEEEEHSDAASTAASQASAPAPLSVTPVHLAPAPDNVVAAMDRVMYGPPAHLPAAQHQLASAIAANTQQDQRAKNEDRAVLAGLEQMMM